MLLYLDDDIIGGVLVKLLKKAGHDVLIPADVGLSGADDPIHLTHAIRSGRPLMTCNYDDFDFDQLHELVRVAGGHHPGVIVVRQDNDRRDLKPAGIVTALANLVARGDPIAGHFTILNFYR